jgi:hypothetical protein
MKRRKQRRIPKNQHPATTGDHGPVPVANVGAVDHDAVDAGIDVILSETLDDVPRDLEGLVRLTPFDLTVLAYRVRLTKVPEAMHLWRGTTNHEAHARQVMDGLAAWDRAQKALA